MKKVLFLTKSFPDTRRSATVLCTHRVMECVAKSGNYEVHALCYRYSGESELEDIDKVIVHRFYPTWWVQIRNKLEVRSSLKKLNRIMEVIQKCITIPFYPNIQPISTRLYYNAAKELYKKESFDIVISEHHCLETLLSGCQLKREFNNLKHMAILWDPIKGQIATTFLPKRFTDKRISKIERIAAQNTNLLISMASIYDYYRNKGDNAADHRIFLNIPAIIPPEPEVPTDYLQFINPDCINIVYSGALSNVQRDPVPIIKLLSQTVLAKRINIVFFSKGAQERIEAESKDFCGTIVYHGYIPIVELHTIYRHADYLLNISHVNANMIPSKIFEYMSFGKPIISTYVTEGDSANKYVSLYPEGLCINLKGSVRDNIDSLNKFLSVKHKRVNFEDVKELFAENTPDRFLVEINGLMNN